MGLFSSIKKAIKKIWKGIKKVVKKVWKAVKKFAKSKFGKVLLAGAAIYFGGAALGAWGGGGGAAATGAAGELAASTVVPQAASTAATGTAAAVGETAAATLAPALGGAVEAGTAAASASAGTTAASSSGLWGTIKTGASKLGGWMEANPLLTKAAGTIISSISQPEPETAEDVIKARRDASNIAGVDYAGRGQPLTIGLIRRTGQDLGHGDYTESTIPTGDQSYG